MDSVVAYTHARRRISELLRDRGLEVADRRVPACPTGPSMTSRRTSSASPTTRRRGTWTAPSTDPWTAAQVDKRRDQTLEQILTEWDETGPRLDKAIADFGAAANQLVFDTATHEHDLRQALDAPGAHDADSTHIALEWILERWSANVTEHGFEPLRLVAGDTTVVAGVGEPVATLTMSGFEALRALSGRRSLAQLAAYDWDADPTLWLPSFTWGPFTPPEHDVVE